MLLPISTFIPARLKSFGVLFLVSAMAFGARVVTAQPGNTCRDTDGTPTPGFNGRIEDTRFSFMTNGENICRWHLVRKDPTAASSDVVDPVTYLINPDVPKAWYPYLIRGIERWKPVFEQFGFRNALAVRAQTPNDRKKPPKHPVYVNAGTSSGGGFGGMATDCTAYPANGEIAECSIDLGGAEGMTSQQVCIWRIVASDPSVPLPCPDTILGGVVQAGFTHEVGHTLGLDHNFYGGAAFPTDSLRSAAFVHRWNHSASIMSYSTYNMVAQPEDHIPVAERWLGIGPYDYFAIAWAYRPIPDAKTSKDELPILERWRSAQDTANYLGNMGDVYTADMGMRLWSGTDLPKAMELRGRNLARIFRRLAAQDSANAQTVAATLPEWWRQQFSELIPLLIGGYRTQPPYPRNKYLVRPIPVEIPRQLQAVRFVLASALYGQDHILQSLDTLAGHGTPLHHTVDADSVPFVFDPAGPPFLGTAKAWQDAQRQVLETIVSAIGKMPPEGLPEACHYLKDATRALQKFETAPAGMPESAKTLRETLTASKSCAEQPEKSP